MDVQRGERRRRVTKHLSLSPIYYLFAHDSPVFPFVFGSIHDTLIPTTTRFS